MYQKEPVSEPKTRQRNQPSGSITRAARTVASGMELVPHDLDAERAAKKAARRKAAQEMVVADKKAERDKREERALQKAADKKAAEERAREEAAAAAIREAERIERAKTDAQRAAEAAAEAEKREAERVAAEALEAERIAAEARAAEEEKAALAAAELAAAEEAELAKVPAWVRRLSRTHVDEILASLAKDKKDNALQPSSPQATAVLYTNSGPVSLELTGWAAEHPDAPRAKALTVLVLRRSAAHDSDIMGKCLPGGEVFVLETRQIPTEPGLVRALITATASTATPLGWVTATRDGITLLEGWEESAIASAKRTAGMGFDPGSFYTSHANFTQATFMKGGVVSDESVLLSSTTSEKRRKKAGKWWRTFGKAEPAVETPGRRLSFRPF